MTRFLQKLAFVFIMIGLFSGTVFSQKNIKSQITDDNGSPKFIQLENAVEFNSKSSELLTEMLNLKQDETYVLNRSEKDKLGQSHYRYQQYYYGVKVEHGNYIVHTKGTKATSLNGDYKEISENFNIIPSLTEPQALTKALAFVGANEYMWESSANEEFAKQTEPAKTFYPKGELVIVENNLSESKSVRSQLNLAYKFNIYAAEPVSRAYIYVNAVTGEVVMKDDIIKTVAASGPADTRYSGTKTINTDSYNGSYRLRDYTRGEGIIIWDMNEGTNYSAAVDFTDLNNTWSAAEFDNENKDNIAMEASWAFSNIYDYWLNVHGRNSFNDLGGLMNVYVHYSVAYDNAYWNGSVFTFGDGSDTYFDALASLDVSAHEHGHGVCSYTSNLTYSYESGALNEAFSDIWGACLEAYAAPEKMVWVMGDDIERRDGHIGLRILSDPNAEGLPDTYLGDYWYTKGTDNGGVHYNNGPFCFWFYLISEGGSGVNDNGDAYSVSGIGIQKAEQIAFRTESVYMTSSSNYAAARTLTIQSAIDLYGAGSNEVIQVTNAMYAIGVGDPYDGGVVTDTEAPTAPANLTASNVTTSSVDLNWTASTDNIGVTGYDVYKNGTYLATTTNTNYSVVGLSAATTYSFYAKAKDAAGNISAASNTVNVTTNEVIIGDDLPMVSTISLTVIRSGRKYYGRSTINVSSNGTPVSNAFVELTWSGSYSGTSSGYTDAAGNLVTQVTVTGTSLTVTINDITATGYYWDMAASEVTESYSAFAEILAIEVATYPNPCASEINFIIEQDHVSNALITIFDLTGKQVINKEVEIIQGFNTIQMDVESLDKGMYIYRISTDDGISEGKIIKK
ncbi:MAG TPA: peptidase M4 [Bacteroidales bacterium]|jgi:Zn-dependent metalloprotease|nr:peptidase M4 [Bacteroidales bacterium]